MRRKAVPARVEALRALLDETRLLMHRMKRTAERLHRRGEMSAGQRSVMMSLQRLGPLTVPVLARSRPVSRQHMQVVVNALLDGGLAALEPNPSHRRSHLVRLTPRGAALVDRMERREIEFLSELELDLPATGLWEAAGVLKRVRETIAAPHRGRGSRRRSRE